MSDAWQELRDEFGEILDAWVIGRTPRRKILDDLLAVVRNSVLDSDEPEG